MSVLIYPTKWLISDDYKTVTIIGHNYTNESVICNIPFRPYRIISTYQDKESFNLLTDLIISKEGNNSIDKNIFFIFAWDKESLDEISEAIEDTVEFIDNDIPMLSLFLYYNNINPGKWILLSEISGTLNIPEYKFSFIGNNIKNDNNKSVLILDNKTISKQRHKIVTTWMIPDNEIDDNYSIDDIININKRINYIRVWYDLNLKMKSPSKIGIQPVNGLYVNFTKEDITNKLAAVLLSKNYNKKLIESLNYENSGLHYLIESGYIDININEIGNNIFNSYEDIIYITSSEIWINDEIGDYKCIIYNGDVCEKDNYRGIGQLINPKFPLIQVYMTHILQEIEIPDSINLDDLLINELVTQNMMYTVHTPIINLIREYGIQIEVPTMVYYYMCEHGPVLMENFSLEKYKINYTWYDNEIKRILYI